MKIRYTVAIDGVQALRNFQGTKHVPDGILVADSIPALLDKLAGMMQMHSTRNAFRSAANRIYRATITPGEKIVRHQVWVDKPIPTTDITGVTWDAINVREPFPPHATSWIQGYNTVEEALKEALTVKNDISMWKVFPIVGVYENEADNISVSLVE